MNVNNKHGYREYPQLSSRILLLGTCFENWVWCGRPRKRFSDKMTYVELRICKALFMFCIIISHLKMLNAFPYTYSINNPLHYSHYMYYLFACCPNNDNQKWYDIFYCVPEKTINKYCKLCMWNHKCPVAIFCFGSDCPLEGIFYNYISDSNYSLSKTTITVKEW